MGSKLYIYRLVQKNLISIQNLFEIGETYETLETVELLADPIEFNLNGKYLMDALNSINSEKVQITTPGIEKSLIVRGSCDVLKSMSVLVPVKTYK